jgi:hypothetical protein
MPSIGLRAVVAIALLLTWLVPGVRLTTSPQERAVAAAATELMCLSSFASVVPASWPAEGRLARSVNGPTLVDVAAPMQRAFDKQWQTDGARVAFVAFAALALLLGQRRFRGAAALPVIAAATLYWWAYQPHWDGYRLLLVTQSLPLWWNAVSQWSWSLQVERLIAPVTVWIALLGGCWVLWRSERVRPFRIAKTLHSRGVQPFLSRVRS